MKKNPAAEPAQEKKAAPAKSRKLPIQEYIAKLDGEDEAGEGDGEDEGEGKIKRIIRLFVAGYSPKEICTPWEKGGAGFNKSTTYRQTGEFKKQKSAPLLTFGTTGFTVYEARVQRMMANKKITREKAEEIIAEKDAEE